MLRLAHTLEAQLRAAMERAFPEAAAAAREAGAPLDPQITAASKPEFGDFQANGALPLAKPLAQPPRTIASAIVAQLAEDSSFAALCEQPQIAGPGFINLTLRPERLAAELRARLGDARLGVPTAAEESGAAPAPVIVDSPAPTSPRRCTWGICAPRSLAIRWRGCWSFAAIRCCASTTWATGAPSSAC
jgi:arginyl-tRNA synthetase